MGGGQGSRRATQGKLGAGSGSGVGKSTKAGVAGAGKPTNAIKKK